MKITFIAWTRYQRRSELLAQQSGATIHFFSFGRKDNLLQAPLKYIVKTWQTWRVLRRERPDIIFVQNPPIFCVLVVFIYNRLYSPGFVIDSHTGAFLSPAWRWSLGIHRFLSRFARATILHNESQGKIVSRWRCNSLVLNDYPGSVSAEEEFVLGERFNVAVISSFSNDEPLDVVFDSARHLDDVCFYVTGDSNRIAARLLANMPKNVYLTGYLRYTKYLGLIRRSDVVIALTTRNHTLLSGANEAVSLGTPLIVSDWPVLRNYFSLGTIYVSNTKEGICVGVRKAQHENALLRRDILVLREQLLARWTQNFAELLKFLRES